MSKFSVLFILFISLRLYANEPSVVLLHSIYNNYFLEFRVQNYHFHCRLYGVIALDKLLDNANVNAICKERLQSFYRADPDSKDFTRNLLAVEQGYHLEFKEKGCALYASGQKTLSQMLLENGLAIIEINFQDREFQSLFEESQRRAQSKRVGFWSDDALKACIYELYKEMP